MNVKNLQHPYTHFNLCTFWHFGIFTVSYKLDFSPAFLAESKQAAVDAATTGLKSISEQRPIMMKLQAKCQRDIKKATTLIDKVVRSYAEEQIYLVTNAIKDLGSVDLSTFDLSKLWG